MTTEQKTRVWWEMLNGGPNPLNIPRDQIMSLYVQTLIDYRKGN